MKAVKHTFYFLLFTFYFFSCQPSPHYQKLVAIPQNAWAYNFRPKFTFEIKDTAAYYQPYFLIRHTNAYPYSNLWLWMNIKTPTDSPGKKFRVNIRLAEQSGKWLGRGMGEIWEQRLRLDVSDSLNFSIPGKYEITLEQNMRINPLPDVLHVGLRVEKIGTAQ
jgi:gliding motility-associated lipoprotein GldH